MGASLLELTEQGIKQSFPELYYNVDAEACVLRIPERHPDVGGVEICDDGDELSVVVGRFTHWHTAQVEPNRVAEASAAVVDEVVSFLRELFADRIIMRGRHFGGGGCYHVDAPPLLARIGIRMRCKYVWSGPLRNL